MSERYREYTADDMLRLGRNALARIDIARDVLPGALSAAMDPHPSTGPLRHSTAVLRWLRQHPRSLPARAHKLLDDVGCSSGTRTAS